jgi:hypothetical protein
MPGGQARADPRRTAGPSFILLWLRRRITLQHRGELYGEGSCRSHTNTSYLTRPADRPTRRRPRGSVLQPLAPSGGDRRCAKVGLNNQDHKSLSFVTISVSPSMFALASWAATRVPYLSPSLAYWLPPGCLLASVTSKPSSTAPSEQVHGKYFLIVVRVCRHVFKSSNKSYIAQHGPHTRPSSAVL